MRNNELKNVVICSYRLTKELERMSPQTVNNLKIQGYKWEASPHCADWYAYKFDEKGSMTIIIINDWYPYKPKLWKRMLRRIWKSI